MIGSLKEEVLLALFVAGANKPASEIYDRVNSARLSTKQKGLSFGSVFTTLNRLADNKLVDFKSSKSESGRQKRLFTISAVGAKALKASQLTRKQILGEHAEPAPGGVFEW